MNTFFIALLLPIYLLASSVIVSVLPHKFFVQKIAGNTVDIIVMIPAGASPHSYEPPPKTILAASQADIWFAIGEGFEGRAIQAIKSHNPALAVVDLRKGLSLIPQGCCHGGEDLHIWMSLRLAKTQAITINNALSERFPENKAIYEKNLKKFLEELSSLDKQITKELAPFKDKTVMVSHPSYGYFCRDYQLKQLSIEMEGHEPTPQKTTVLLNLAKQLQIKKIFVQPQYSSKGAEIFADILKAGIVTLDPYSEDYLNSMKNIAEAFREGL